MMIDRKEIEMKLSLYEVKMALGRMHDAVLVLVLVLVDVITWLRAAYENLRIQDKLATPSPPGRVTIIARRAQ